MQAGSVAQTKAMFPNPPASRCFPVRYCSLLFAIVRHCSAKKYCPAPVPSRRPVAAFLRVVARHGAAMARHGRPASPAPATRPVGFSPATRHATWFFPVPPATPRRATPSPANRFFTSHESRITSHGLYAFFPTISHDFPAFPAILRIPPSPGAGVRPPSAAAPATLRAASAASNAK